MWEFPWTDSENLIASRITEELLKYTYGELKISFSIPINWIDVFDIFSNFRLQEPFGLDAGTGDPAASGEYGRYYYIESMTYDFINQKINITAVDMQYLLKQCMIMAHCGDVPENYDNASEADKMFAYIGDCDSDAMPDGAPLKRICPCDICE